MKFLFLLYLVCFFSIPAAFTLEPEKKDIFPPQIKEAPVIDGKLDDKAWEKAYYIKSFVNNAVPAPAKVQTEAFVCYDEKCLYFAFKCHEPDMDGLRGSPFTVQRDDDVYTNECVEVFIDTSHDHFSCYQFIVNFKGTKQDALFNDFNFKPEPKQWDGIWYAASRIGKDHWSTEIAIPFYTLNIPAGRIDMIGVNLAREKRTLPGEYSCWACTCGGFHNYEKYGHLRDLQIQPSRILLSDIDWGETKWGENKIKLKIKNNGDKSWNGKVYLQLKNVRGEKLYDYSQNTELKAGEIREITLPYFCKKSGKYIGVLGTEDKEGKVFTPVFSTPRIIPSPLAVNSGSLLLYRNETGCIPIKLNAVDLKNYTIETEFIFNGNIVRKSTVTPKSFDAVINIVTEGLASGIYLLNIKLFDKKNVVSTLQKNMEIIEKF
ncbi:MAG: sugar-binding protein [Victivallaceae bacterium]|nr:sugar-binding protein [Victivallaceae bacterium]